jgi:YgiT-type zinc finger domain-containing protein
MDSQGLARSWQALTAEIVTGMVDWRRQHPTATLRAIEAALDERWAVARARILQEAALSSAAADLGRADERPLCPACGGRMEARGQAERTLTTHGGQSIALRRGRAVCPACGTGLFPPG